MDYKLANVLGTVYSRGNLIFTPDGKSVLSPVGNRVSCFDVVNNRSFTFDYEHRKNISRIAINPRATLFISVDTDGRGILVNFRLRTVIHYFNFKHKVRAIEFSPNGKQIAVAVGKQVEVWRTPTADDERQFAPFIRHRVYTGHFADITAIQWSKDSRFFLTSSNDMSAHIYSLHNADAEAASTLAGHRDAVIGAYFSDSQETIFTVSRDGAQFEWVWSDEEDKWTISDRHYFSQNSKVSCVDFHPSTNLLVVGFESGIFGLYDLPQCNLVQTLSISQNAVNHVQINSTGEWLLFGAAELGQLLVWEWQSESYVLKQQSHYDSMNTLQYSPDGTKIVTGADDGKIKVWDASSGFCIVTFSQHIAAVTALTFSKRGNVLFSASLDGSVRAWDLVRYRNFRTFTAPNRLQFTSLAVDPSGELVCAGSLNDYDIHVWNVQNSQYVDKLSGHEGPVSALDFSADGSTLASASWDHTARLWNFFGRSALSEPMQLQAEALALQIRPDGKTIAIATLDGLITFWNVEHCQQVGEIDGRNDISGGRHQDDRFTAANSSRAKHFTTLCFSADGKTIIGGGNSKFVCLYDVANQVLLRRFTISKNMALEGTQEFLNSKNLTEAGPLSLLNEEEDEMNVNGPDEILPGAQRGATSIRKLRPAIKASGIQYSPSIAGFSIASTEGLLVYSLKLGELFDPIDLDVDVTVQSCLEFLGRKEFLSALVMAFRIGETALIRRVSESIPSSNIELVCRSLPETYIARLLGFLVKEGEDTPHVEFTLIWIKSLLQTHGKFIASERQNLSVQLRAIQKYLLSNKSILRVAQNNIYSAQALRGPPPEPQDV